MLYSLENAKKLSDKYLFIGRFLSKIIFSLKYDLQKAEITIDVERYCLGALISAFIYGVMFIFIGMAFYRIPWKDYELAITNNISGVATAIIILLIIRLSYGTGNVVVLFQLCGIPHDESRRGLSEHRA